MCKHCERLIEDAEHKDLIHSFMALAAEKVNRKLAECGYGAEPVTADDIDIEMTVNARVYMPNAISNSHEVTRLLYKTLNEIHK